MYPLPIRTRGFFFFRVRRKRGKFFEGNRNKGFLGGFYMEGIFWGKGF
jgi:hypothetical protein